MKKNVPLSSRCFVTNLIHRNLAVLEALVTCSNWNEIMKVHVVFSLNVTGSFTDDIRVVSVVRHRLYGSLLAKKVPEITEHRINMNGKIFSHFIAEKKISFAE